MEPLITFDNLPTTTKIDGIFYPINYGYRAMMAIEIQMFSKNNDEQKVLNALNLFYLENIPVNREKAIEYMLWFHRCGENKGRSKKGGASKGKRGYCFSQDAPLIYAAFRQQYQINLKNTLNADLHWWEFCALFNSLTEDTKMSKVIYWRSCNLSEVPKNKRSFIKKMKEVYAIKENGTVESRMNLAERNARLKDYVKKRMEECRK